MPELSLNPLLLLLLLLSVSLSTPEAFFVLTRQWPGRERVNKAAAALFLIVCE